MLRPQGNTAIRSGSPSLRPAHTGQKRQGWDCHSPQKLRFVSRFSQGVEVGLNSRIAIMPPGVTGRTPSRKERPESQSEAQFSHVLPPHLYPDFRWKSIYIITKKTCMWIGYWMVQCAHLSISKLW